MATGRQRAAVLEFLRSRMVPGWVSTEEVYDGTVRGEAPHRGHALNETAIKSALDELLAIDGLVRRRDHDPADETDASTADWCAVRGGLIYHYWTATPLPTAGDRVTIFVSGHARRGIVDTAKASDGSAEKRKLTIVLDPQPNGA
jgi:hypothetical protein